MRLGRNVCVILVLASLAEGRLIRPPGCREKDGADCGSDIYPNGRGGTCILNKCRKRCRTDKGCKIVPGRCRTYDIPNGSGKTKFCGAKRHIRRLNEKYNGISGWQFADFGESCAASCRVPKFQACNADGQNRLNTKERIDFVLGLLLNFPRPLNTDPDDSGDFVPAKSSTLSYIVESPSTSRCDSLPPAKVQRICCCSDAANPSRACPFE